MPPKRVMRISGLVFTQEDLQAIADEHGETLEELCIDIDDWDEGNRVTLQGMRFPKLQTLRLSALPLRDLVLRKEEYPSLTELDIENADKVQTFSLDLPQLRRLKFYHMEIRDDSDFGPSLARSPELLLVDGYKVWGLGGQPHYLHLENCVHFKLARSDDLESLDMYAPRLETLYLAACFSLTRLRVHQHKLEPDKVAEFSRLAAEVRRVPGPSHYKAWNAGIDRIRKSLMPPNICHDCRGLSRPKITVDLCNAGCMDRYTLHHLKHHRRIGVRNVERTYPGGGEMLGDPFSDGEVEDDDSDSDGYRPHSDDDDDDDDDDDGGVRRQGASEAAAASLPAQAGQAQQPPQERRGSSSSGAFKGLKKGFLL